EETRDRRADRDLLRCRLDASRRRDEVIAADERLGGPARRRRRFGPALHGDRASHGESGKQLHPVSPADPPVKPRDARSGSPLAIRSAATITAGHTLRASVLKEAHLAPSAGNRRSEPLGDGYSA